MRVGLDFDNTLAGYDRVFPQVAKHLNLLPLSFTGTKADVKRQLFACSESGEQQWMRLQGQIYGRFIGGAELLPGVSRFLTQCKSKRVDIFIISHKTQFGHYDKDKINLHQAAMHWMACHGFFEPDGLNIKQRNVFFLTTREQKLDQIKRLNLDLFIDDLPEVLEHKAFPKKVQKILFSPHHNGVAKPYPSFPTWDAITNKVFNFTQSIPDISDIAKRFTHDNTATLSDGSKGGNNRLLKVTTADGSFAFKQYYQDLSQNRCQKENQALHLLLALGEKNIPKPLKHKNEWHAALFEWIEGITIKQPGDSDIKAMIAFISRLQTYSAQPLAKNIGSAKEACLCLQQLLQQINQRKEKLLLASCLYHELESFIHDSIQPIFNAICKQVKNSYFNRGISLNTTLKKNQQILSPSDFGLHNALKTKNQMLYFLDFEYFGWDDTVKLTADTLLHPGMTLSSNQKKMFRSSMIDLFSADDAFFEQRLNLLYPLYALRWCLIILNPFLPEYQTQQEFTGNKQIHALQKKRLQKAKSLFNQIIPQVKS